MTSNRVKLDPVYVASLRTNRKRPKMNEEMIPYLPKIRKASDEYYKKTLDFLPKVIEEDKTVLYNGIELRLTLLRPLRTENTRLPVVIYYHGGGWVFGTKYTHGKVIRDICIKCHVVVVFLSYTLAPDAKFPVAHEEAYSALCWVLENGDSILVNTKKLALCGDSCGGNLASIVPLMAKDRGQSSDIIKAQIIVYPAIIGSETNYNSFELLGNGEYGSPIEEGMFFHRVYFGDEEQSKYTSPLMATKEELSGLPPALVLTAEGDYLREVGEEYAGKLLEAGVPTMSARLIGSIHNFLEVRTETPVYKQALAMIDTHLKIAFADNESKL